MCEQTRKAIEKLAREMNLTTGKPIYKQKLTFTAGETTNRVTIEVPKDAAPCGYALRLANLPTVDGVDNATVYYALDSNLKADKELAELKTRAGMFLEAAGGASHVFPQNTRRIDLDFCALGIDQATEATASIVAELRELVPLKASKC
ncbi:MAG: hypothetical protein V3V10_02225 [Planctomycetota bacterium]